MQKISNELVVLLLSVLFTTACKKDLKHLCDDKQAPTVSVFASNLNNPRGLKFGPDGALYLAEGGVGGTNSTAKSCTQVVAPVGPYTGSETGARILRFNASGSPTTITDKLPTSQT